MIPFSERFDRMLTAIEGDDMDSFVCLGKDAPQEIFDDKNAWLLRYSILRDRHDFVKWMIPHCNTSVMYNAPIRLAIEVGNRQTIRLLLATPDRNGKRVNDLNFAIREAIGKGETQDMDLLIPHCDKEALRKSAGNDADLLSKIDSILLSGKVSTKIFHGFGYKGF